MVEMTPEPAVHALSHLLRQGILEIRAQATAGDEASERLAKSA
jgi:hypothetical protein